MMTPETYFSTVDFGDKRFNKRLLKFIENSEEKPQKTIIEAEKSSYQKSSGNKGKASLTN